MREAIRFLIYAELRDISLELFHRLLFRRLHNVGDRGHVGERDSEFAQKCGHVAFLSVQFVLPVRQGEHSKRAVLELASVRNDVRNQQG